MGGAIRTSIFIGARCTQELKPTATVPLYTRSETKPTATVLQDGHRLIGTSVHGHTILMGINRSTLRDPSQLQPGTPHHVPGRTWQPFNSKEWKL